MAFEDERASFLVQAGFKDTEAKLYLALLKTGETTAGALQKATKMPRPVVYRTLSELHEKGFVDKELTMPNNFRATPLNLVLEIILKRKTQDYRELEKKTEAFLRKFEQPEKEAGRAHEYKLVIIDGRERIIQGMKRQHDHAQFSVDILSTFPRWLQIVDECHENYQNALTRNVRYRVIAETGDINPVFPDAVRALLGSSGFKLKLTRDVRNINSAIFDQKEATFNFFPSKTIAESPLMYTNHPSFVVMCQGYFESVWKSAKSFTL